MEFVMSEMFNPPHPGRVLRNTVCREDGGITVTDFAKKLKVSRVALSRVLNCRAGISAELAIRLEAALGSSAQMWLGMQSAYDLARARKKRHPKIDRLAA
jgi:antitoxin HigA-1